MSEDIRTIDLSGSDAHLSAALRKSVESACVETGFMYLVGHDISAQVIAEMRSALAEYFDQPLEAKLTAQVSPQNYRGYIPRAYFSANDGEGEADGYEGYKLHAETDAAASVCAESDLYGPNLWPGHPPTLKPLLENYWRLCDEVCEKILSVFALLLEQDVARFVDLFRHPLTNMTLLYYPAAETAFTGIHAHKDTDALTLLAPDSSAGLEILPRGCKQWRGLPERPGAILANLGDMMEIWSGGRFLSTPHRVQMRPGVARYSFPYFCVPRHDVVIEPLLPPVPEFELRQPADAGAISREIWMSNWPDAAPVSEALNPRIG